MRMKEWKKLEERLYKVEKEAADKAAKETRYRDALVYANAKEMNNDKEAGRRNIVQPGECLKMTILMMN